MSSSPVSPPESVADLLSSSPLQSSPQSIVHQSASIPPAMKDVSTASSRHSRNSLVYPRKRPSPHGVSKSHKSPLLPAYGHARKSPRSAKSAMIQQRQREAAILTLRREGVLLEEEYRDEIQCYMYEMEVCLLQPYLPTAFTHFFAAVHHVIYAVHGSAARDSVAYATVSRRLFGRDPLQFSPASGNFVSRSQHRRSLRFPPHCLH